MSRKMFVRFLGATTRGECLLTMEQKLKHRSDIHFARKLWHFSGVMFIVVVYSQVSRSMALQLMTTFAFLAVLIDLVRHQWPGANRLVLSVFHPIMREHERHGLAGTSYLMLGVFLIMLLFPKSVVILALIFLGVADPLASYVGIRYGQDKIVGHKSLQGSMAAFIACTVLSGVYFYTQNLMLERLLIVSILAGLIGALAELLPVGKLDDNFTFPLVASSLLWVLFFVFGGFPV